MGQHMLRIDDAYFTMQRVRDNLTATTDPTANDDATQDADGGYGVGSRWFNTSNGKIWMCRDATIGAAEWQWINVTDHGELTGLDDDDHAQYLKEKASGGLAIEVPTHTHEDADDAGTVSHDVLTDVSTDDHHAVDHDHVGTGSGHGGQIDHGALAGLGDDDHPQYLLDKASGGLAIEVPAHTHEDADDAGTVSHDVLTDVSADDHHAQSHAHDGVDSSGTVAHSDTTGQTADDHHAQSHAHDGVDGSGTVAHGDLTGVGTDDHHTRYTDAEAVSATAASYEAAGSIATHAASAAAHHAKYTDGEAVTAMGAKGDANPLNHDRYTDAEAVTATAGSYEAAGAIATHAGDADAHHNESHTIVSHSDANMTPGAGTDGYVIKLDDATGRFVLAAEAGGGGTPASTVESETAFGIAAAVGTDTEYARQDHTHGSPTNPVTAHAADVDAHHARYTDTEAVDAIEAEADLNLDAGGSLILPTRAIVTNPGSGAAKIEVPVDGSGYVNGEPHVIVGDGSANRRLAFTDTVKDADEVDIADSGGYFTGTDVEAALQEAGADIATNAGALATHAANADAHHDEDHTLASHITDIDLTGQADDDFLQRDSGVWVPKNFAEQVRGVARPYAHSYTTVDIGGYGAGGAPVFTWGTPTHVNNFTGVFSWNSTYKGWQVAEDGLYLFIYTVATSGGGAATDWMQPFLNGAGTNRGVVTRPFQTGGPYYSVGSVPFYLSSGDTLALYVNTSSTQTIYGIHTRQFIIQLGGDVTP